MAIRVILNVSDRHYRFRLIIHFFPDLIEQIRQIEDCRKKSDYELVELIMACIAMSLFKADSRNAFNNERQEGNFKENYQKTFKMRLPHMDTVENVMRRINPDELQQLKTDMIRILLEKKTFHKFRLFKKMVCHSRRRHWPHDIFQKALRALPD